METALLLLLLFVLVFSLFAGFEAAAQTPALLHLPLLSGLNLFSGIIILAALLAAGLTYGGDYDFAAMLGGVATALATAALTGGYLLTDKALEKE